MWWFWWFLASTGALARWIGESVGAGLARIAGEADYLGRRTRTASPAERSAGLFRFFVSCVVIGVELALLMVLRIGASSPIALAIAWVAIVILPKPTPGVLLVVARMLAVVFTLTNLGVLYDSIKAKLPSIQNYGAIIGSFGFVIWTALFLWALSALRLSRHSQQKSVSNRSLEYR
jgi:hypothetical protein